MLNRENLWHGLETLTDEELLRIAGAGDAEYRIYEDLKTTLKDSRLRHSLGVMCTAVVMAGLFKPELKDQARLAGLLHDCAKSVSDALGHAPKGTELARERYGIEDEEILSAIRWHTTGRAHMTVLEKILYTADYIEPFRRELPGLTEVRQASLEELDRGVALCAQRTLSYLEAMNMPIDPATREAAQYYGAMGEIHV